MLQFKSFFLTLSLLVGGIFLLPGQNDIEMVFPDGAIVHYAKWPTGLQARATSVQEWRREVARNNELVKADRYDFNAQGQLVTYFHYDANLSETLEYEYDQYGRPSTVRYSNDNGPLYTYTYSYASDHYSISWRDDQRLVGRELFYFDEEYRLTEKKTYNRPGEDAPLQLVSRELYAYSGGGNEPTGEMHYDYVLTGKDKGQVRQWKRLHSFDPETGLREKTETYKALMVWPGNWKRSGDFTEVVAEKTYTYDENAQLLTKTLDDDMYDRINERWSFTYRLSGLRQKLWEEFDLAGEVVASTMTRYYEHGGVAGFEYLRDRMGNPEYRSSFVIR